MSATSRGSMAAGPLLRSTFTPIHEQSIAQTAAARIPIASRRPYSTTTTTTTSNNPAAPSPNTLPVTAATTTPPVVDPAALGQPRPHHPVTAHPRSLYRIRAGLILSRPPILTREQTPFEQAFYLYQKRLNERLSTPFARQFYFRRGQPALIDFSIKLKERQAVMAREIGRMTRTGRDAWDDEALVSEGRELADPAYVRERLFTDSESRVSEDGEVLSFEDRSRVERPLGRETEADRTGDVRRLDRKLDRSLYLVVLDRKGRWIFPQDDIRPEEDVYETASRALTETAGVNMNTWLIGRHPIAHEHREPTYATDREKEGERFLKRRGAEVFYIKGRIMAGQADLSKNEFGLTDFMWLTKEELKKQLQPGLYSSVEAAIPAQ